MASLVTRLGSSSILVTVFMMSVIWPFAVVIASAVL